MPRMAIITHVIYAHNMLLHFRGFDCRFRHFSLLDAPGYRWVCHTQGRLQAPSSANAVAIDDYERKSAFALCFILAFAIVVSPRLSSRRFSMIARRLRSPRLFAGEGYPASPTMR